MPVGYFERRDPTMLKTILNAVRAVLCEIVNRRLRHILRN